MSKLHDVEGIHPSPPHHTTPPSAPPQVARVVGRPEHEVRQLNMYAAEGDVTHFGQALEACRVRACWDAALASAGYEEALRRVADFNKEHRWGAGGREWG